MKKEEQYKYEKMFYDNLAKQNKTSQRLKIATKITQGIISNDVLMYHCATTSEEKGVKPKTVVVDMAYEITDELLRQENGKETK